MAIFSDYHEDQHPQQSFSSFLSFNAVLDPSSPLDFLESALNFASQKSKLFESDSAEKDIIMLVHSIKERTKGQEAESEKKKVAVKEQDGKPKENKFVPNQGNGLDVENYSWGHTLEEVTINVPVPQGTKSRLVLCDIKNSYLKVGLKGQSPIIDGKLYKVVKVDDCSTGPRHFEALSEN